MFFGKGYHQVSDDEVFKHYEIGGRHYVLMSVPPPVDETGRQAYPMPRLMQALSAGIAAFAASMAKARRDARWAMEPKQPSRTYIDFPRSEHETKVIIMPEPGEK